MGRSPISMIMISVYTATWNAAHHESGSQPFCRGAFPPRRSWYLRVSVTRTLKLARKSARVHYCPWYLKVSVSRTFDPGTWTFQGASHIGPLMLSHLVFKGFDSPSPGSSFLGSIQRTRAHNTSASACRHSEYLMVSVPRNLRIPRALIGSRELSFSGASHVGLLS